MLLYKFTVTEGIALHYWAWWHSSTPSR